MSVRVYVEGGGDHNKALQTRCRQGFSEFFKKSGLQDRMPRVIACGGRRQAYESFLTAHENAEIGDTPLLLVDSEEPLLGEPWDHVRLREGDGWARPPAASDSHIHLMVQAMEAWFHADKDELQAYYGKDFRAKALSPRQDVENILKADLFSGLRGATKDCQKGEYSKGDHSFQILARIDPAKVRASSPHCERLLTFLDRVCTL